MTRTNKAIICCVAATILMLGIATAIELTHRDFNGHVDIQAYGLELSSYNQTFVLSNVTGDTATVEINVTNTGEQNVYVTYQLINVETNIEVNVQNFTEQLGPGESNICTIVVTLKAPTTDSNFIVRFIATEG